MSGRGRLIIGLIVVVCGLAAGSWWLYAGTKSAPSAAAAAPRVWPALTHQVAVEVLNITPAVGLARVGTLELRAAGLDVKYFGDGDATQRRTRGTRVLVRGPDTTGVGRVLEVLGKIPVEHVAQSDKLIDLTVILGEDYHAFKRKP